MIKHKGLFLSFLKLLSITFFISCTAEVEKIIPQVEKKQLVAPVILPESKRIKEDELISFEYLPNDAEVYYSLDGSEPTVNSFLYTKPFKIVEKEDVVLVRAKSFKSGYLPSMISEKIYIIERSVYLTSLTVSSGVLSPAFHQDTKNYSLNVLNEVNTITTSFDSILSDVGYSVNGTLNTSKSQTIGLNEGKNKVTISVEKSGRTIDYIIEITRQSTNPSNVCQLKTLGVKVNEKDLTLTPAFTSNVFKYSVSLEYSIAQLELLLEASDLLSSIKVNGNNYSGNNIVFLNDGLNTIKIELTAEDGISVLNYVLEVKRGENVLSNNALLSALTISSLELDIPFSVSLFKYSAIVDYTTESITINAERSHSGSTITFNGVETNIIPLVVGENIIKIVVLAEDKKTSIEYTITIIKENEIIVRNDNADLKVLTSDKSSFSPIFDKDVTSYVMSVENTVTSLVLTAVTDDSGATVKINSKDSPATIAGLVEGPNDVKIIVTAKDGVTAKTYNITIIKAEKPVVNEKNADLKALTSDKSSFSPIFNKDIMSYVMSVENTVTSLVLTAVTDDSGATVKINGKDSPATIAGLVEGNNEVKIIVTAKDGITTKTYIVNINRSKIPVTTDNNTDLKSLTSDKSSLSPLFDKTVTNYMLTVDNTITSVILTAAVDITGATLKINGKDSPAAISSLVEGNNEVKIIVTAKDGITTKTYIVTVVREKAPVTDDNIALLKTLTSDTSALSPLFDSTVKNYILSVDNSVTSVVLTAGVEISGSTVKINTKTSPAIISNLQEGNNQVEIIVTAKDGTTTNSYFITIIRAITPVTDTIAFLKSLSSDISTITPAFDKMNTNYSLSVEYNIDSVIFTASAEVSGATLKINGKDSPASIGSLVEGNNEVNIIVTAKDGTTVKNYTINVIKAKAPVTDKIIVHAKNYTKIWAWDATKNYTGGVWTDRPLMTEEGNSWYTYTINATTCNLLFTDPGQSPDLTRTAGEWWYMNGTWTDYNTDGPKTPVISVSPAAGTYITTQNVVLTSSNVTGDIIYYTIDGSTPTLSSQTYSSPISITTGTTTVKAIGYNALAVPTTGDVKSVTYTINPDADLVIPTITASQAAGGYENPITVSFTIKDNKVASTTAYYTTDGTEPATTSSVYKTGDASGSGLTGSTISINENKTVRFLIVDGSGNTAKASFYYRIGKITTTRFDPRQESIYFLLTSRWFDGDSANTVGDEFCSWTEARANDSILDDGFTGPEDVSWRGDFKGLVEKMDYIKALGFSTIWITPVVQNRSPLAYHGYHGWDFTREDPRLESPGYDFQRVVDEAHSRDMKICLDIVINHSGRFGIKNFSEIQYARDPALYPVPEGWESFTWDEAKYNQGVSQSFPNGWEYDGLTSPGMVDGEALPPYLEFAQNVRPFTQANITTFPNLMTDKNASGFLKFQWPSTESYCKTVDGVGTPGSLTYEQYKTSPRRHRGHNTGFPTGSGSFDNFPDAHFDSLHEDCPDLNTENPDVQEYLLNAYYRYIDMGVDMFRVDTVMHMHKETLNTMYWPQLLARAEQSKASRGGSDFFIFGEVANFVSNITDKASALREQNYTFDQSVNDKSDNTNHLLNGNNYRTPDYSHKAPNASSPYHVSVINMISHNAFCNNEGSAYNAALGNDYWYNDATFLPWYTDSHDYGPNKGETRWAGDFAAAWSMLFTFRGIPIVYYGSEIRFGAGKPNDWPGGGSNGVNMSLEKTGRSYYGPHLEGSVTATDFGEFTASGAVAATLNNDLSKHLMGLNKIRQAVPALQMGQYSADGHSGGWAGFKRRYVGTNKITQEPIDSYALVGIGAATHTFTGVLPGTYVDCVTGNEVTASGGNVTFTVSNGGNAGLGVYVLKGLATPAPGKITQPSPFLL
ncbi:MAG: hypothetical protein A2Y30_08845 [Spirochaetes bacterium GWE1_32_154]|nr:MAG: hypothetical protein A2Y30_08845 [Spirochaetes bacterium GWE1_32_154]